MDIERLYREAAPKLLNYLVANGVDNAAASDIVQESFLRLWKKREELVDNESLVSGLLWTIAKNLQKDRWRKDSRIDFKEEITDEDDTRAAGASRAATPGDSAYLRNRIRAALAELPPLLREAYTMFQLMELPIAEIARRTNVTESNVKVRIFRAKEKLRERLKDLM